MRAGLTISTLGHLLLLAWGLVTFSTKPFEAAPADSLPVEILSDAEFSRLTAGSKSGQKTQAPKPVVDKVAEPKPVKEPESLAAKVSDKPEIVTSAAEKAPPPEPKPKPPQEPAKAEPEPRLDQIAEVLKKEAKRPEPPKKHAEAPVPPKKPPQPQAKFDADKIQALLDKRDPRRQALTGAVLNQTAALGSPIGTAATLTQTELDALRAQIQACWNPPVGVADAKDLIVVVRLMLKPDGSLSADPMVLNRSSNPLFRVAAESALRAIRRCQPFRLPVAKYDVWKDVEVNFDPRDMFRG